MIPLHLRKKLRSEKAKPKHFEVMPPIGTLTPGQRINVQVKFMPTEEVRNDWRTLQRSAYLFKSQGVSSALFIVRISCDYMLSGH